MTFRQIMISTATVLPCIEDFLATMGGKTCKHVINEYGHLCINIYFDEKRLQEFINEHPELTTVKPEDPAPDCMAR
jgi:hypothetical protein